MAGFSGRNGMRGRPDQILHFCRKIPLLRFEGSGIALSPLQNLSEKY
jgi:hypothetical protein